MQPERELEHSSTTHGLKLKSSNRHSLKTYGLPLQGECMGLVPEPSLTDYIFCCRKHEISDGHSRPQPRQPRFQLPLAGDSHLVSDAHPRLNIPHPLTPPTLYHQTSRHKGRGTKEGVVTTPTFTFLPSTVSVESPSDHQVQHSATETHCGTLQPDGPHSTNDSLPLHHCPHPVLLPPSAFIRPSSTDPPLRGHREGRGPAVDHQRGGGGLCDPAVRSQIVHVRDELRRYHQVRLKQKSLEQQVARLGQSGSSTQLAEVSLAILYCVCVCVCVCACVCVCVCV